MLWTRLWVSNQTQYLTQAHGGNARNGSYGQVRQKAFISGFVILSLSLSDFVKSHFKSQAFALHKILFEACYLISVLSGILSRVGKKEFFSKLEEFTALGILWADLLFAIEGLAASGVILWDMATERDGLYKGGVAVRATEQSCLCRFHDDWLIHFFRFIWNPRLSRFYYFRLNWRFRCLFFLVNREQLLMTLYGALCLNW